MTATTTVFESEIGELSLLSRGKVRDIYAVDDAHLAIVASDRLSAFDVILPDPIPGKGVVLTRMSRQWFARMEAIIPNHLTTLRLADVISDQSTAALLEDRTMIVKRADPLPIEAVARGYLIGSGWDDYRRTGVVCGHRLPDGLQQAARLDPAIFTPATKADMGAHDENISFEQMSARIGTHIAKHVRDATMAIFDAASRFAEPRGIIIADTKLEFGIDSDGQLILIDEILTPDSSRFWPAEQYEMGTSPPSFDKQFVRDYLETLDWDKTAPGPALPEAVQDGTSARYYRALELLASPT